jgi:hypothetical protein
MVLEKLKHLKSILSMILISSSECEWGFSQGNLIVTPTRPSLWQEQCLHCSFLKL